MTRFAMRAFLLVTLLAGSLSLSGCELLGLGDDTEVTRATVLELGANFFAAENDLLYQVNDETEYEGGYTAFSDIRVGDVVEVEYEEIEGATRLALEIELGSRNSP